jgi:Pyruvate/2-oxoacid:ferredoxin oxidoreductase delta subunit
MSSRLQPGRRTALDEARHRLSCGTCFGCDNCYGMCPDIAIHKFADVLGGVPGDR